MENAQVPDPPQMWNFPHFFFLTGSLRLFQPGIFVNPWITLISSFNARGVNNERVTPTVLSGVQQPVAVRWPAANIHIAISCYPPPPLSISQEPGIQRVSGGGVTKWGQIAAAGRGTATGPVCSRSSVTIM